MATLSPAALAAFATDSTTKTNLAILLPEIEKSQTLINELNTYAENYDPETITLGTPGTASEFNRAGNIEIASAALAGADTNSAYAATVATLLAHELGHATDPDGDEPIIASNPLQAAEIGNNNEATATYYEYKAATDLGAVMYDGRDGTNPSYNSLQQQFNLIAAQDAGNDALSFHKFAFIFLICISIISLSYRARADSLTPEYQKCLDAHQDNASWSGCGQDEIKRQESSLAETWKQTSEDIKKYASSNKYSMCKGCGEVAISSFENEQENWKKWQDSACKYYISGLFGHEEEVLAYPSCKAKVIADRVMALRRLSKGIKENMQH